MTQSEMKNAPPLYGWAIASGMGVVAFAVSFLLVGIEGNGSVAIGAVVALIVGVIFTVAENDAPPAKGPGTAPTVTSGADTARVSTPATPAPIPAAAASTMTTSADAPAAAASTPATPEPVAATPAPAASVAPDSAADAADTVEGTKPDALAGPVGEADDLKRISGVGPVLEGKLNGLGIYHFWQIARWNADEVSWVDGFLNFRGRIDRDNWIEQAKTLAADSPSKPPA